MRAVLGVSDGRSGSKGRSRIGAAGVADAHRAETEAAGLREQPYSQIIGKVVWEERGGIKCIAFAPQEKV